LKKKKKNSHSVLRLELGGGKMLLLDPRLHQRVQLRKILRHPAADQEVDILEIVGGDRGQAGRGGTIPHTLPRLH
jgi:hypothetical protein